MVDGAWRSRRQISSEVAGGDKDCLFEMTGDGEDGRGSRTTGGKSSRQADWLAP